MIYATLLAIALLVLAFATWAFLRARSPVRGCEDPATAIRRADAFAHAVSHKGVEDATS
jgi:hypothetical protein